MPFIELGDINKLILKIPAKGDINWSDEIKLECFQKIVDHDHSSNQGVRIPNGGLGPDCVTAAKIADSAIQIEHKYTQEIASHTGSAETVTAIVTGEAMKINYRIKSSSTYQIGTVTAMCTAPSAGYIQDEFIGDSLATFAITSNTIKVDGTSGDEMIFSIEFKENTT